MLCLYDEKDIPDALLNIKIPWADYFIKQKVTKYLDGTDIRIVNIVEESSLLNASTIYGKFSDMPIGIGDLSEGCKTLLCINHAIKTHNIANFIFNITSCGGNAINHLITEMTTDVDVYAYCEHKDFGKDKKNIKIKVGNEIVTSIIDAEQAYLEMCREDHLWGDEEDA